MALLKNELYKLFRTKKLYIFMGIDLFFLAFNLLGYQPGNNNTIWTFTYGQSAPMALTDIFTLFMSFFIPIFIADSFAGEYRQGTLKLSLLHPVSRLCLLKAKLGSLLVLLLILTVFFVTAAYAIGVFHLGWGDGFEYNGSLYTPVHGMFITFGSYLLLIFPAMAYGLLTAIIAILSGNMTAAILASVGIMTIGFNLNTVPGIGPYSLSYHIAYLYKYFVPKFSGPSGFLAIGMLALYFVLFGIFLVLFFRKKDLVY